MIDPDTFLTPLYVIVDDFCKTSLPLEPHSGPQAAQIPLDFVVKS
jgi:hypothetical protein